MSQRLQAHNEDNFKRSWERVTCHFDLGAPSDLWADCWFKMSDRVKYSDSEALACVERLIRHAPSQAANVACHLGGAMLQHQAAAFGRFDCLTALLATEGADVNVTNGAGWTSLHWACSMGQTEVVALLLEHPEIDTTIAPNNDARCTPLAVALDAGYGDIADIIDPRGGSSERLRGQGWRSRFDACGFCGANNAQRYCGFAGVVAYCNQRCADRHWKEMHRSDCGSALAKPPEVLDADSAAMLRLDSSRNPAVRAAHGRRTRMMNSSAGLAASKRNTPTAWRNTAALDQLMADGSATSWREMHHQRIES